MFRDSHRKRTHIYLEGTWSIARCFENMLLQRCAINKYNELSGICVLNASLHFQLKISSVFIYNKAMLLNSYSSIDTGIVLNIHMSVLLLYWFCLFFPLAVPTRSLSQWTLLGCQQTKTTGVPQRRKRGWRSKVMTGRWDMGSRDEWRQGGRWFSQSSELKTGPANQHDGQMMLQGSYWMLYCINRSF